MSLLGLLGRGFGIGGAVGSLTLSIVDNEDGTGAVATVGNVMTGGAVTVYVAEFSGTMTGLVFASEGTRIGNGTVSLSLSTGAYLAYSVATDDDGNVSISEVVGFNVTSQLTSVWDDILDAVVSQITALALPGLTVVRKQKLPWDLERATAGLYVTPVIERQEPYENVHDRIVYGVQVTTFFASNRSLTSQIDRHLAWRQQIGKKFRHQPLASVASVYDCHIEPGPVFEPEAFKNQFDAQSLVLRFFSRETRGV